MGLDSDGTKFTFAAHAAGVSFQKTAMLGRQNFFPAADQLQKLLDLRQSGLSAAEFLADSDGYAEKWFSYLGAEEIVAIDNSDYEGAAVVADLNMPIESALKNRFTAVVDGGCLEHVFNFPQAIKNSMEMLSLGGHFLGITPANNFCGHGFYQFSPELYFRIFSEENGFAPPRVLTKEKQHLVSRASIRESLAAEWSCKITGPLISSSWRRRSKTARSSSSRRNKAITRGKWEATTNKSSPRKSRARRRTASRCSPRNGRKMLRPLAANLSIGRRYACYQPIDEDSLLRGGFALDCPEV